MGVFNELNRCVALDFGWPTRWSGFALDLDLEKRKTLRTVMLRLTDEGGERGLLLVNAHSVNMDTLDPTLFHRDYKGLLTRRVTAWAEGKWYQTFLSTLGDQELLINELLDRRRLA